MNFPHLLNVAGYDYHLETLDRGLLYTRKLQPTPYVFVPMIYPNDFQSWLVDGLFRARLSHANQPAEFQRGVPHPYVQTDHMVKRVGGDSETETFARLFWEEISRPR
jgi:hypothetical protein